MSNPPPSPPQEPPLDGAQTSPLDVSHYSTEQLAALVTAFDESRFPREHALITAELSRRHGDLAAVPGAGQSHRLEIRYTEHDGVRGWLEAKRQHNVLYGAGSVELSADGLTLSGMSRTWLGVAQLSQRASSLATVRNVGIDGNRVQFTLVDGRRRRNASLRVETPDQAALLAAALPSERDPGFQSAWEELTRFNRELDQGTPDTRVTTILVALNALIFLVMLSVSFTPLQPYVPRFQGWAANAGTLTLNGDWWRLLTATFVHANLPHVALNLWALWNVGRLCERLYGRWTYLTVYLLLGIVASMASVVWDANRISVGASGAIFGLLGALLAYLMLSAWRVPTAIIKAYRWSTAAFVVINLGAGAVDFTVDNAAHVGGLVAGLLAGAILVAHQRSGVIGTVRPARLAVATVALVLVGLLGVWFSRGGTATTPESYRWIKAHDWYASAETTNLKAWSDLERDIANGAVTRAAAVDRFKGDVLPFWNNTKIRLERELSEPRPSSLTAALANFVAAKRSFAKAWIAAVEGSDLSRGKDYDAATGEALRAGARFFYRSTRQQLWDRPHSLVDSPLVARVRAWLPWHTQKCVENRNALERNDMSGAVGDGPLRRHAAGCAAQAEIRTGQFAALDARLTHDAGHLLDLNDGTSTLSGDFRGLNDYLEYSGINEQQLLVTLSNWRRAIPGSAYPDLLAADVFETFAWKARGHGYATSVSNEQWQFFSQQLEMASAALEDAAGAADRTPLFYSLSLAIGLDRSEGLDHLRIVFDAGEQRFPGDRGLHRAMLRALLPRWGGSFSDIARFIAEVSAAEQRWTPAARYADLYAVYAELEGDESDLFSDASADWTRLARGFEELTTRFPRSAAFWNAYANFACRAGDVARYRALRDRVKAQSVESVWTAKFSQKSCDEKFASVTGQAPASPAPFAANTAPDTSTALRSSPTPTPTVTSFWGIRLGELRREVEHEKGAPLKSSGNTALYNAARPQDDAIIEIDYGPASASPNARVRAVYYLGDRDHAPPGLPFVFGLSGEQLGERFAAVEWSAVPNNDSELEMFAGGLTAYLWHREVKKYGIQDYYRDP